MTVGAPPTPIMASSCDSSIGEGRDRGGGPWNPLASQPSQSVSSGAGRNPFSKIKVNGAGELAQWAKEFVQAWEPEFDTWNQHKIEENGPPYNFL